MYFLLCIILFSICRTVLFTHVIFCLAYAGPSPPKRSGLHRYQLLLYEQSNDSTVVTSGNLNGNRASFNINEFVKINNFACFVAAFQFTAENV